MGFPPRELKELYDQADYATIALEFNNIYSEIQSYGRND